MNDNSVLDYPGIHKGKKLKDVPASYLVGLYNQAYDLPKPFGNWLEDNIDDLEEAAGHGEDATLDSEFDLK